METLDILQGSNEWLAARKNYFTASEAPAMMGAGYITRDELLKQKKTGVVPEVSDFLQRLFDKGHAAEALARPIAEKIVEEDFYPVTGVSDCGKYLASFDGLTMDETMGFEHKLLNKKLVDQIAREDLDPKYYWQLEHQMLVSGAESIVFVCSDGTEENFHPMIYTAVEGRREQLIAGWEIFEKDLVEYVAVEPVKTLVAALIKTPPNLDVQLVGEVRTSNFPAYRKHMLSLIDSVNTDLKNDLDFVNAENQAKFFKEAEKKLGATKDAWLAQTGSLDDLMREVEDVRSAMASKRLQLEKLIKSEKEARRHTIVIDAQAKLSDYIQELQEPMGSLRLPVIPVDFAGVIKGKRLLSSVQEAVDSELRDTKLAAAACANNMRLNLELYAASAEGYESLFPDLQQLVLKASDDLTATIKTRIADHKAAEEEKARKAAERVESQRVADAALGSQSGHEKETPPTTETVSTHPAVEEHARQVEFIAKTQSHAIYRMPNKEGVEVREIVGFGNGSISITAAEWIGLSALIDTAFSSDKAA